MFCFPIYHIMIGNIIFSTILQEYYEIAALNIIMQYLTETSAAELQKELVEIDDPFCSDVCFNYKK